MYERARKKEKKKKYEIPSHTSVGLYIFVLNMTTMNPSSYDACAEIFVGAGWAGVYSFYRRVMEDPEVLGPKACLFEESWRIGGRTYSVKINHTALTEDDDFVQDVGAYRFSPDMHLPGDLILHDLRLETECYEASCPNAKEDLPPPLMFNYSAPLRRVVDPDTRLPSGYATPIHKMIERAQAHGARVFTQVGLSGMTFRPSQEENKDKILLEFYDSVNKQTIDIVSPDVLVLNLPRNKLFEVKGVEESLEPSVVDTLKCIVFDWPRLPTIGPTALAKAYLYYEDAWWHTVLNETEGAWPPSNSFVATRTKEGVYFNIRWHDGPVACSSPNKCHGLLESYYSVTNETFYSSLSRSPDEPMGVIWNNDGRPDSIEKLSRAHAGVLDILGPLLDAKQLNTSRLGNPPSGLAVGIWRRPTKEFPLGQGYTAPTKVYYDPTISGTPDKACGVPGLTDKSYRDNVLQPWGSEYPIFLVNNDWVCANVKYFYGDWAEESLLQAERAMFSLGMEKPMWLNGTYYEEKVASQVTIKPSLDFTTNTSSGRTDFPFDLPWLWIGLILGTLLLYKAKWSTRSKNYSPLP